jgi:hypothetical protein
MRLADHNSVAIAILVLVALLSGPGAAQQSAPPRRESCVEVQIGGERSYSCRNQQMRRDVDRARPTPNVAPLDARSLDVRIGIVNVPAVQQQYGKNFGKSVVPFRPPAPTMSVPRR